MRPICMTVALVAFGFAAFAGAVLEKSTMHCHVDTDKCFFQVSDSNDGQRARYADAQTWCAAFDNGMVAQIVSDVDAAQLARDVRNSLGVTAQQWVGVDDLAAEGTYTWLDGRPLAYSNWAPSQPANNDNRDCVQRTAGDGSLQPDWSMTRCTGRKRAICSTVPVPWVRHPVEHCFESSFFEYKCFYHVYDTGSSSSSSGSGSSGSGSSVSPAQAQAMCTALDGGNSSSTGGGRLARIETARDQAEMGAFAATLPALSGGFWLGLTDADSEGAATWVPDAAPLGAFTNWSLSSPSNSNNRDCVRTTGAGNDWAWEWARCDDSGVAASSVLCSHSWPTGNTPAPTPFPGAEDLAQSAVYCHPELDKCFFQVTDTEQDDRANYADARGWCATFGGHVVSIRSAAEEAALAADVAAMGVGGTHYIGLSDEDTEGQLLWHDGSLPALSYTNWRSGQPNNNNGNDCAQRVLSTGEWVMTQCSRQRRVVCSTPNTWALHPAQRCFAVNATANKCYYHVTDTVQGMRQQASTAQRMCSAVIPPLAAGGTLATVFSAAEQQQLAAFAASVQTAYGYWLGLSDAAVEGAATWPTAGGSGPFTHWFADGSPNAEYLDCVLVSARTAYAWQWVSCLSRLVVLCARYEARQPPAAERCFPLAGNSGGNEKCFFVPPLATQPVSRNDAAAACAQAVYDPAATLATVNSTQEGAELALFWAGQNISAGSSYWLGLAWDAQQQRFQWTDDAALPSPPAYTNWDTDFPQSQQGMCTRNVRAVLPSGQWRDSSTCSAEEDADDELLALPLCSRYLFAPAPQAVPLQPSADFFGVMLLVYNQTGNLEMLGEVLYRLAEVANSDWLGDNGAPYEFHTAH